MLLVMRGCEPVTPSRRLSIDLILGRLVLDPLTWPRREICISGWALDTLWLGCISGWAVDTLRPGPLAITIAISDDRHTYMDRSDELFDVRKKTAGFLTYHGFMTIASSSRIISLDI
jgi:hypothetical protein